MYKYLYLFSECFEQYYSEALDSFTDKVCKHALLTSLFEPVKAMDSSNDNDNDDKDAISSTENKEAMITLTSNDQQIFHVPLAAARLSGFIVDTLGFDDEQEDTDSTNKLKKSYEPIRIPRVSADILQLVVEFLLYYQTNPMPSVARPIIGDTFEEVITDPWYQNFITNIHRSSTSYDVVHANQMQHTSRSTENNANDIQSTPMQNNHVEANTTSRKSVFRVLEAANFMEISPLIDLTCLWCTFQISGKTAEEVSNAYLVHVVVCAHKKRDAYFSLT
jgi:Skp1 family, tetramerisation domain